MTDAKPEVLCNLCGLSCKLSHGDNDPIQGPHGLINHVVHGGYNSTPGNGLGALDDITSYRFSLCEFCLDWLFSQFKLPVKTSDYMGGEELPAWKPAAQRVEEDEWRKMKAEFQAEYVRRIKARGQ